MVLIPTGDPPHKPHEHLASAKDRYEMVRLATASDPLLSISDVDVRRSGKSYDRYGPASAAGIRIGTQLYFLIGLDAFLEFPTWRDPETLLTLCSFVILSRPGLSFQALSALPLIPRLRKHLSWTSMPDGATSGRPCRPPIADMPSIASQQRIGVRDPGKNRAGDLHGKSVAACGGILYTSTSYLPRGRRSHEHRRPQP